MNKESQNLEYFILIYNNEWDVLTRQSVNKIYLAFPCAKCLNLISQEGCEEAQGLQHSQAKRNNTSC